MFTYKQAKDANGTSGSGRTTCPFYDEIDSILGTRAASSPPLLLDGGASENSVTEDEPSKLVFILLFYIVLSTIFFCPKQLACK